MGYALATPPATSRRRRGRNVQARWDRAVASGEPLQMLDVARDAALALAARAHRDLPATARDLTELLARRIHAAVETTTREAGL